MLGENRGHWFVLVGFSTERHITVSRRHGVRGDAGTCISGLRQHRSRDVSGYRGLNSKYHSP